MTRSGIKDIIRSKMDELAPGDQISGSPINKHIDIELEEATNWLLMNAPLYLLPKEPYEPSVAQKKLIYDSGSKNAYILVPSDFLRLAYLKFQDWEKPVFNLITEEHPDYPIQLNPYTQAGKSKPIVAHIYYNPPSVGEYDNYLLCFSAEEDVDPILYIKKQKAEALNDKLVEPLAWLTTARLFQIFGYGDKYKLAVEQYNNFIASQKI